METNQQIAITRPIPDTLAKCELTHQVRMPIDLDLARRQHAEYESTLTELDCTVIHLPALNSQPDSVFVEDTMLVLPEVAIALRPGAESRRGEVRSTADAVLPYRTIRTIDAPATIDGGDLLVMGRNIYLGLSSRSSSEGLRQLRHILAAWDYTLHGVPIKHCLHLKSAVTAIDDDTIICNPAWIDPARIETGRVIECDPAEPHGANVLRVSGHVVAGDFPESNRRIQQAGFEVRALDLSELAKAEGAVTCCSVIFRT